MRKSAVYLRIALSLTFLCIPYLSWQRGRAQNQEDEYGLQGQPRHFGTGSNAELRWARNLTWRYLEDHREKFDLDRKNHMKMLRAWVDDQAMAHVHVQQTFADVPVFGGEVIVHWNTDGTLADVTNSWVTDLQVDPAPTLKADTAVAVATAALGCSECQTSAPEVNLWVLRRDEIDRLAYQVKLRHENGQRGPGMPVYFVDAHTGGVIWEYDNLQTATGSSLYSGTVSFNTFYKSSDATYYLEDLTRRIGTYSYRNGTTTAFNITDADDFWESSTNRAAVDAQYGMLKVFDYFRSTYRRDGLDGSGGPFFTTSQDGSTPLFAARVNYNHNYVNAFWNGSYLTFGDGDGSISGPLVTVDIIGHEMTHILTERTAGLVYSGETGALNESMSDVFGAMVERYAKGESASGEPAVDGPSTTNTWAIAEESWTPGTAGDALRYLDDPHRASNNGFTSDDDPDHYVERYTGLADNSGVHVNSGIPNKAFYLLAKGGTHHRGGTMTGIGADDAARIWYRALTTYMTSNTNFAGARTATETAAFRLFGRGSQQLLAVKNAWCLVGVGACPGTPPETDGPLALQNGVPVLNLAGSNGSEKYYYLAVPTGASNLSFQISGGSGDADLYIKFGGLPTTNDYDCRPYNSGNNETCTVAAPAVGNWFVMIKGYSAYSGLTLVGSYRPPPIQLQNGVTISGLSGASGSERLYYLDVASGATNLSFGTSGGFGDGDLYVKFGSPPSTTNYDCRSRGSTNAETCSFPRTAAPGNWYVLIKGYAGYSGMSLTGTYRGSVSQMDRLESDSILGSFLLIQASPTSQRFRVHYERQLRAG